MFRTGPNLRCELTARIARHPDTRRGERDNRAMTAYLARITVSDELDDDGRAGMADALHAQETHDAGSGAVTFVVLGEAPDLAVASHAAHQHAAEILDGFTYEVEVADMP